MVLPIALQNLINVAVTSADVVMLGRSGKPSFPDPPWRDRCSSS